jgi:beta-lactamase class A
MSRAKLRRDRRRPVRLVPENSPPKISPLTLLTPALEEVKSPPPVRLRKSSSRQRQSPWPQKIGIYLLRLGIVGGGLAIVVGTVLTVLAPTKFLGSSASAPGGIKPQQLIGDLWSQKPLKPEKPKVGNATGQEIGPLQQKIALLSRASQPKITPYGYFLDVDTGQYINFGGDKPLPAASTIKSPSPLLFLRT